MINIGVWGVLGIISIIFLISYWKTKNAVWGGLFLGAFIGLIVFLVIDDFGWLTIIKGSIK